jgi:hypothetical protein
MEGVFGTEKKNPHATEHMLRTAHVAYCIHISHKYRDWQNYETKQC